MRKLPVCLFLSILSLTALASALKASDDDAGGGKAEDAGRQAACGLLDRPGSRALMDGLLYKLLNLCGREHELGRVRQETAFGDDATSSASAAGAADVRVNDPVDDACAPDEAIVDVAVPRFRGFAEPVTLTVSGLPGSVSGDFSVNPVTPPGATELTIGDTAG